MRQLFTWRFVAAVAALGGLAVLVNAVFVEGDRLEAVIVDPNPPRRVDLIETVDRFERSTDFAMTEEGTTVGFLDVVLDAERAMRIAPGTDGEITCGDLETTDRCVVLADLLGEAVLWFALVPRAANDTIRLGPIEDLEAGYAIFENGWEIPFADVIERNCGDEDIPTFSDFLRRFGPGSTSVVDLETRLVDEVICGVEVAPPPTTLPDVPESAPAGALGDG